MGAEEIDLHNGLICFGYTSDKLRVDVADLDDWISNSSYPWAAY